MIKELIITESRLTISLRGVYLKVLNFEDLCVSIREFCLTKAPKQQIMIINPDDLALPLSEVAAQVIDFYKHDILMNQSKW